MAERAENMSEPAPKRRRRRPDIYDIRAMVRMAVTLGVGGTVLWGAILGDIWLWRLLYG